MRLNYWVVYCGGSVMQNPPALAGVEAPAADPTIVISSSAMTFTLASVPSSVTNLKLILQASMSKSNGITRSYSDAAAIGDPLTPSTTSYDIKSGYEAKYGAPTSATPKVFFKYFYVNTVTGEKSGEVLANGKLSE